MKRSVILPLVLALLLPLLHSCEASPSVSPSPEDVSPSPSSSSENVETWEREGAHVFTAGLAEEISAEQSWLRAGLVADVTVTGRRTDLDAAMLTNFEATVNKTLVGAQHESLILLQDGDATSTIRDYPLHQKGTRLLAFLTPLFDKDDETKIVYRALGGHQSIMYITELDGKTYVLDRFGYLTAEPEWADTAVDAETFEAVDAKALEDDSLHVTPVRIFEYDAFVEKLLAIPGE